MITNLRHLVTDRWHRARRGHELREDGVSLIEMLVAMTMVTVAVLGLLGELAADIKQQRTEKTETNAVRLASSSLESARSLPFASLISLTGTSTTTTAVQGVTYTQVTNLQLCSATDGPGVCTTPATGAPETARASIDVSWTNNGTTHDVHMVRNIANDGTTTLSSGISPLGNCGGSGTTLVAGHLALSPSSVNVNSAGNPTQSVTATLTETGLSNATCVPLTWSDDNGAHQLSMTGTNGTYSVTIPASSITKSGASGGTIPFTATVPGTQAVPSTALTIIGAPTFSGNCTISVAGLPLSTITLVPLTRNSLLAASLACTTTNLSKTDSVTATYASGTSTKSVTMTSTDGASWTGSIPSGSAMVKTGTSEAVTFALVRASDNASTSQSATATLS